MKLGDVSVAFVELMRLAMSRLGHDATPMLQQFQLDDLKLASPDARISIPRFMRLGHACIEVSDKPWLGLEMGRQTNWRHMNYCLVLTRVVALNLNWSKAAASPVSIRLAPTMPTTYLS